MATAISLINKALFLNGCSSQINPATPELKQYTFEALIDMLNDWGSQDIVFSYDVPTNQADELNNPSDTNQVIQFKLSEISAPLFQKVAPQYVMDRASELYDDMQTTYGVVPECAPPCTLPIGSGNEFDVNGSKFYYNSCDYLADDTGVPLLVEGD